MFLTLKHVLSCSCTDFFCSILFRFVVKASTKQKPSMDFATAQREKVGCVKQTRSVSVRLWFWRWEAVLIFERTDVSAHTCSVCAVSTYVAEKPSMADGTAPR